MKGGPSKAIRGLRVALFAAVMALGPVPVFVGAQESGSAGRGYIFPFVSGNNALSGTQFQDLLKFWQNPPKSPAEVSPQELELGKSAVEAAAQNKLLQGAPSQVHVFVSDNGKKSELQESALTSVNVTPGDDLSIEFLDSGSFASNYAKVFGTPLVGLDQLVSSVSLTVINPNGSSSRPPLVIKPSSSDSSGVAKIVIPHDRESLRNLPVYSPVLVDPNGVVDDESLLQVQITYVDKSIATFYALYFRPISISLVGATAFYQTDLVRLAAVTSFDAVLSPANLSAGVWGVKVRFGFHKFLGITSISILAPVVYTILADPTLSLHSTVGIGASVNFGDVFTVGVGVDYFNKAANGGTPILQFMIGKDFAQAYTFQVGASRNSAGASGGT